MAAERGPEARGAVRRLPTQERSRARVERMLEAARALIAAEGSEQLRMSAVAERAGVSIGSLYQFFPDKAALVRTLAERYNAEGQACVRAEFAGVESEAALHRALGCVADAYYGFFLGEPVLRDIWRATQADRALQDLDAADLAAHAAQLEAVLARLRPGADPASRRTLALVVMQLLAGAVRLAIDLPRPQGDAAIETFKRLLPRRLTRLLDGD